MAKLIYTIKIQADMTEEDLKLYNELTKEESDRQLSELPRDLEKELSIKEGHILDVTAELREGEVE